MKERVSEQGNSPSSSADRELWVEKDFPALRIINNVPPLLQESKQWRIGENVVGIIEGGARRFPGNFQLTIVEIEGNIDRRGNYVGDEQCKVPTAK